MCSEDVRMYDGMMVLEGIEWLCDMKYQVAANDSILRERSINK